MIDSAKDKVAEAGTKVADKVAKETFNIAEKADDVKTKCTILPIMQKSN